LGDFSELFIFSFFGDMFSKKKEGICKRIFSLFFVYNFFSENGQKFAKLKLEITGN